MSGKPTLSIVVAGLFGALLAVQALGACAQEPRPPAAAPDARPTATVPDAFPAPDEAYVLDTTPDVRLKRKGGASFARISKNVAIRAGDVLRVGEGTATATLLCKDVCVLRTGEYRECCTPNCQVVAMVRSGAPSRPDSVARRDLSPDEAQRLAQREAAIEALGLGETTAMFLKVNLHASWRLRETPGELDALSRKLNTSASQTELQDVYFHVRRKTGDLYLQLNQKQGAIEQYHRIIDVTVPPHEPASADVGLERALAHRRLADLQESGDPAAAIRHLESARTIYLRQGEPEKARDVKRRVNELRPTRGPR